MSEVHHPSCRPSDSHVVLLCSQCGYQKPVDDSKPDPEKEALKATVVRLREAFSPVLSVCAEENSATDGDFQRGAPVTKAQIRKMQEALSTTPSLREAEAKEKVVEAANRLIVKLRTLPASPYELDEDRALAAAVDALAQSRQPSKESAQERREGK